jgi:hypothetical protein
MIHYVDCGAAFIAASNGTVNSTLLPEELHPHTEGYRMLAACLKPVVDDLVLGACMPISLGLRPCFSSVVSVELTLNGTASCSERQSRLITLLTVVRCVTLVVPNI